MNECSWPSGTYSHGGATVEEGVREGIWGEVCTLALPFGGVRIHGVVATGTKSPFPGLEGAEYVARALILKEPGLRPGHYMRSVNYLPSREVVEVHGSDAARTRHAVLSIGLAFQQMLGRTADPSDQSALLNDGLLEMARRMAYQVAAGRAKRIMHGSLTFSNVALDGRWLDFGTITALPDYGRIVTAHRKPDFWRDHLSLIREFFDLTFYVRKYSPGGHTARLVSGHDLATSYLQVLESRLRVEFLKLTGFPETLFESVPAPIASELYDVLTEIALCGNDEPFTTSDSDRTTTYDLNHILSRLCACSDPVEGHQKLLRILDFGRLRRRLVNAYFAWRDACVAAGKAKGMSPDALTLYAAVSGDRRNRAVPGPFRWKLMDDIRAALQAAEPAAAIGTLIGNRIDAATVHLGEPGEQGALIDVDGETQTRTFLADDGTATIERTGSVERFSLSDLAGTDIGYGVLGIHAVTRNGNETEHASSP